MRHTYFHAAFPQTLAVRQCSRWTRQSKMFTVAELLAPCVTRNSIWHWHRALTCSSLMEALRACGNFSLRIFDLLVGRLGFRQTLGTAYTAHTDNAPKRPSNSHRQMTFLDLPRELRDKIYEYACVSNKPISALRYRLCAGRWRVEDELLPVPELVYVSKIVRAGALEVFVSRNTFALPLHCPRCDQQEYLTHWRSALGPLAMHVRRLEFYIRHRHAHARFDGLAGLDTFDNVFAIALAEDITITHVAKLSRFRGALDRFRAVRLRILGEVEAAGLPR